MLFLLLVPGVALAVHPQCALFLQSFYRNLIDAIQVEAPMAPTLAVDIRILTPFRTLASDPLDGREYIRRTEKQIHLVRSDYGVPGSWSYENGASSDQHEFFREYFLRYHPEEDGKHLSPVAEHVLHPYSRSAPIHAEFSRDVARVFRFYDLRNTVTAEKISELVESEKLFDPRRAVQISLHRRGTDELAGFMRVLDGSKTPFMTSGSDVRAPVTLAGDDPRIDIEKAYPSLKLRQGDEEIYEISKLAVDPDLVNGTPAFLRAAAMYLQLKYGDEIPENAKIFARTPEKVARIHTRPPPPGYIPNFANAQGNYGYGLKRRFSPEDLGYGPDSTDRICILEISVREFVALYLRYEVPAYWETVMRSHYCRMQVRISHG